MTEKTLVSRCCNATTGRYYATPSKVEGIGLNEIRTVELHRIKALISEI